jgi:protease-4
VVALLRRAELDPSIKGVVLRVDSPGGSALASDVMWRALRRLSREKPVVASMVDVAASGGYYLSMACDQVVAEELTVTGSIVRELLTSCCW